MPDYSATLNDSLQGLKIGLPREYFGDGLDSAVAASIEGAIDLYKGMGAEVIDISLPNTGLAVPTYYVVAPAECSSNLSRFDWGAFPVTAAKIPRIWKTSTNAPGARVSVPRSSVVS